MLSCSEELLLRDRRSSRARSYLCDSDSRRRSMYGLLQCQRRLNRPETRDDRVRKIALGEPGRLMRFWCAKNLFALLGVAALVMPI